MNRGALETILGAVVLLVAVGFVVFGARTVDIQGSDGYTLNARFLKVGGLERGSDVRISGVKVGTVVERTLDNESFEAVVTFTVRKDLRLPVDTEAGVTAEGLFPGLSEDVLTAGQDIVQTRDFQALEDTVSEIIFLATDAN